MADRTSAEIFSSIIEILDSRDKTRAQMIEAVYKETGMYDFSDYQLSDKAQEILRKYDLLDED